MMRRKINAFAFVVYFVLSISVFFKIEASENLTSDSLLRRITFQTWSFPQEKVYVSTDRDAYVSGDTIRFRAFLVDAATHAKPRQVSKYIYVELINPFGEKTDRIKVMRKDGVFAGLLPLDPEMPEGNYTLCAYTQFMRNSGNEYFFRKSIPVLSQLSSRYHFDIQTENGILRATLKERDTDRPVRVENIAVFGPEGEFFATRIRKRSDYSMKITDRMKQAGHAIVKFDKYEKFATIPNDTNGISVTFHPEGGHLIPATTNILAFKAVDTRGLSKPITGRIIDGDGQTICDFKTDHKGMGAVKLIPEPENSYSAIIDGRQYFIPNADNDASSLSVSPLSIDSISIRVLGKRVSPFFLIAHTGGLVTLATEMPESGLRLERSKLGSGIVQLLLTDDSGDILSSRMIFNHADYIYGEETNSLPEGDYAVRASVNANPDTCSSIVSQLLLQSELKGLIEDPDYYFRRRDSVTDYHLDLLMLTQGWERYDLKSALHNEYAKPELPMEIGGEISGTVKSRWKGKPLNKAVVMLISPQLDFADQTITDEDGRFVFKGFDWPDLTAFTIQVLGKNGKKEHNYAVDEEEIPWIPPVEDARGQCDINATIDSDLLTAGTVMLEELVVTAPLGSEQARREMLAALGVRSFSSKEMDSQHITSYEQVIRKIAGLRIIDGNLVASSARGAYNSGISGIPVEYWVDGVQWTPSSSSSGNFARSGAPTLMNAPTSSTDTYSISMHNTLKEFEGTYPIHIVETIEYYRPSSAMMISQSAAMGGGALVVTTKDGSNITEWDDDLFIRTFSPLGYQNQPEAYSPHYIYDPTSNEATYRAAWFPRLTDVSSLPDNTHLYLEIEGIAEGYMPVMIRKKPQRQND